MSSVWGTPVSNSEWTEIGANVRGTGNPLVFTCNRDFTFIALQGTTAVNNVPNDTAIGIHYTAGAMVRVGTASYSVGGVANNFERFFIRLTDPGTSSAQVMTWVPGVRSDT